MKWFPKQAAAATPAASRAVQTALALLLCVAAGVAQAALPIEHWTTKSGARVYFVRADAIPMLDISINFDAGSRRAPRDKAGLASLTNAMLGRGADGLSEFDISERLADVGAIRSGGAGEDRASVTLRTLTDKAQLEQALEVVERTLHTPTFPKEVFDREKQRVIQALREAEIKPETISSRRYSSLLYPQHPYGADASSETVATLERDDLAEFYRRHYGAKRAVVAMIGAIDRAQAEAIAERLTRGLPPSTEPEPLPRVDPPRPANLRIPHPATQSHILMGTIGVERGHPDYFPLLVGNYILGGGGFVSRLTHEVREKRGLAYSVYSYFNPLAQPGPFTIGLQTQKEQTDTALEVVRGTLGKFVAEGPTATELAAAKQNLVGGFPLRIDSNRKILDNLAAIGFYGLPLDYLERWPERVEQVGLEDVREAFKRHVDPGKLVTVVVGAGENGR